MLLRRARGRLRRLTRSELPSIVLMASALVVAVRPYPLHLVPATDTTPAVSKVPPVPLATLGSRPLDSLTPPFFSYPSLYLIQSVSSNGVTPSFRGESGFGGSTSFYFFHPCYLLYISFPCLYLLSGVSGAGNLGGVLTFLFDGFVHDCFLQQGPGLSEERVTSYDQPGFGVQTRLVLFFSLPLLLLLLSSLCVCVYASFPAGNLGPGFVARGPG